MAPTTLTRRELYDLVWSTPVQKLAKQFGLSDRGLAKLCERHRVPTPPRGYWAKRDAGKRVKQAIFSRSDDHNLDRVVIHGSEPLASDIQEVIDRHRVPQERVAVVAMDAATGSAAIPWRELHSAIRETARTLRKESVLGDVARAFGSNMCGVEVGVASVERAIHILQSLCAALNRGGMRVQGGEDSLLVFRGDQKCKLRLKEQTRRVPHVVTEKELANENMWSYLPPHKYDYVRRGELRIELNEGYGPLGSKTKWTDGKKQLELYLHEIVSDIVVYFDLLIVEQEKAKKRALYDEEIARRREITRKRKERELSRLSFVEQLIGKQQKIQELRSLLSGLRIGQVGDAIPNYARMIAWAREKLAVIEAQLAPEVIEGLLQDAGLFPAPDFDELKEPTMEPPLPP